MNILDHHNGLFYMLDDINRYSNGQLLYTLRKSNVGNKLENGYWFLGDQKSIAVSFWTGVSRKSYLPNIGLIIEDSGLIFLEITTDENEGPKYSFIMDKIIPLLELPEKQEYQGEYKFRHRLGPIDLLKEVIDRFLTDQKLIIDDAIMDFHSQYFTKKDNDRDKIDFINRVEFNKNYHRIVKYFEHRKAQKQYELAEGLDEKKGTYLHSFGVRNFGNLANAEIDTLPFKNRWVFLTGENGSGKTMLLKAIALVLGRGKIPSDLFNDKREESFFGYELLKKENEINKHTRLGNDKGSIYARTPIVQGFAAYGAFRLTQAKQYSVAGKKPTEVQLSKNGRLDSLFSKIPKGLIDLPSTLKDWTKNTQLFQQFMDREYFIIKVLTAIVPGLIDIHFNKKSKGVSADYFIQFDEDDHVKRLSYDKLSSGTKSILLFVSDIIIRFYDQQPKVEDPSKFKGVVLIDEIDLHLHPKAQKDLIINLSSVFPGIQFIVTTHSPIPLLGAPSNSALFRINRMNTDNVIERLDYIESNIGKLMPNHILTSDLFDFQSLTSIQNKDRLDVFTGDTMSEFVEFEKLKDENDILDPDNRAFIEKLKSKFSEKD
ncbi:AAA family ATPase [Reichenbachiella sp.]|uniref:AAA family ATPase n=1 Tax=Reichenbachiella sp. TaxID=2184521 RepID=UPI003299356F